MLTITLIIIIIFQAGVMKVEGGIQLENGDSFVLGYKMDPLPNTLVLGCPVFVQQRELIAIKLECIAEQLTFLHNCKPQTCVLHREHRCQVMKEGKLVTITKPAYMCDKDSNREFILNAYSFYNEIPPNIDSIS